VGFDLEKKKRNFSVATSGDLLKKKKEEDTRGEKKGRPRVAMEESSTSQKAPQKESNMDIHFTPEEGSTIRGRMHPLLPGQATRGYFPRSLKNAIREGLCTQ